MTSPEMHLLHVTENFTRSGGGQPVVIAGHLVWQTKMGWKVELLHTAADALAVSGARLTCCPPSWPGKVWRWSPSLHTCLRRLISGGVDVLHLHGIWTAPQAIASRLGVQYGIPGIISFHGQLLEEAVERASLTARLKKQQYMRWIGNQIVRRARVLHAITKQERDRLKQLFPDCIIEVIPNCIDVDAVEREISQVDHTGNGDKQVLFLGRLDERKGVSLLLEAFLCADLPDDWSLCIAGPEDTPGLRARLEHMAKHSGVRKNRIKISGPVYGQDKWRLLAGSSLVCLPSFHEVIGMVNLEAAVCGKPVLTTPYTGLEGWEKAGGVLVDPSVKALADALRQVASWSDSERISRGASLKAWVSNHYSLKRIRTQWVELYGEASK